MNKVLLTIIVVTMIMISGCSMAVQEIKDGLSVATLKLDARGHMGMITDIIVTKNREIISCSDDKTIKVWDEHGKLLRRIDGQIATGQKGMVSVIALSPDEKLLAVGGFLKDDILVEIRLYDYHSGKLLRLLKSHTNAVKSLAFSPDGATLVSGSGDKNVKVWDTHTYELKSTIEYHTDQVLAVKIIDGYVYSTSLDKTIAKHTLEGQFITSYRHSEALLSLAFSKTDIATCGLGDKILILDRDLKLKHTITSTTQPSDLDYSADGKTLLAGAGRYSLRYHK